MYSKLFKFLALAVLLHAMQASAQTMTNSPYSRYGIGDLYMRDMGRTLALGGASIAEGTPLFLNSVNPAANTELYTQRFIYDVGMDVRYTSTESESRSQKNCNTTFSYLMGGFAAKPWWFFTFMLKPYSSVGYSYSDTTQVSFDGHSTGYIQKYSGKGGLSQVSLSTAFKFLKMFSAGATGSVLFGNIERHHTMSSSSPAGRVNGLNTTASGQMAYDRNYVVHGLKYDLGLRISRGFKSRKDSLRDALSISAGAVFGCEAKLKSRSELLLTSYSTMQNSDRVTAFHSHSDTLANDTLFSGNLEIPASVGLGVSINVLGKYTFNADYRCQDWDAFRMPGQEESAQMRKMTYCGLGIQYVHEVGAPKFYKNIIYRAGIHKQQTYYKVNGYGIDETAISFGVGLPIRRLFLNVSCEAGKRGSASNGLYEERYFLASFSLTCHNDWFIKRKFK